MTHFPEEVIIEYITTYITDNYNHSPDGNWININSVMTSDDKYRLGFNIAENWVHDYKLSYSWKLEDFVADYQQVSKIEANKILLKIFFKQKKNGVKFSSPRERKVIPAIDLSDLTNIPEMKSLNSEDVIRNKIGRKAIRYLIHRNFEAKHIKKYDLKFSDQFECYTCKGEKYIEGEMCPTCKASGRNPYYGWMIIPSYENGNFVYFQGRNLDSTSSFRYRNPNSIPKSQVIFFYDLLKEHDRIFITEGPTDAMTLYNESVCCIMGNRISNPQIQKIMKKNPKQIIFIPDYDKTPEKRKIISKALSRNIKDVRSFVNSSIDIGVYKWYLKHKDEGKDLNDINHTKVDEDLIEMYSIKTEFKEKLYNKD